MKQNMLSRSSLWCQELFQGRHLSEIAELFFGNCRRSVSQKIHRVKIRILYLAVNIDLNLESACDCG